MSTSSYVLEPTTATTKTEQTKTRPLRDLLGTLLVIQIPHDDSKQPFGRSDRGVQQPRPLREKNRDAPPTNTAPTSSKTGQNQNNTCTYAKRKVQKKTVQNTSYTEDPQDVSDAIPAVDKHMNTYVLFPLGDPVYAGHAAIIPAGITFLWAILLCTGFVEIDVSAGFYATGTETTGKQIFPRESLG